MTDEEVKEMMDDPTKAAIETIRGQLDCIEEVYKQFRDEPVHYSDDMIRNCCSIIQLANDTIYRKHNRR